jgi:hypothetical protein
VPVRDLAAFRGPIAVIVAGRDSGHRIGGRRLFAALSGPKRLFERPEATRNGLDLSPHLPLWEEAVRFLEMKRR